MDHSKPRDTRSLSCSFCGKGRREVLKLISGPSVFICDECVGLCNDLIAEGASEVPEIAALEQTSLLDFLILHFPGRAVDSIPLGELRSAIRTEWERRLPKPPAPLPLPSVPTDPDLEALATLYGVPAIDLVDVLKEANRAPGACLLIEGALARRYAALPVSIAYRPDRTLIVAMADPADQEALQALRIATGLSIAPVVAQEAELRSIIDRLYRRIDAMRERVREAEARIGRGARVQDVLPTLHDIPERELAAFLSKQYGIPTMDLDGFEIAPEVAALIPEETQRRHALVPVNRVGGSLIIAMADPSNIHAIDDVKFVTDHHVEVVVASEAAIRRKIDKHFPRPS